MDILLCMNDVDDGLVMESMELLGPVLMQPPAPEPRRGLFGLYGASAWAAAVGIVAAVGLTVSLILGAPKLTGMLAALLHPDETQTEETTADEPEETTPEGQPVPVTVDATQQLQVAISILQYLEENGVIGEADRIDVTNLNDLQLWWKEDRFQVIFGDATQLSYKIKLMKTAIDGYMETYDSGILDVSMTIQPDPDKEYQVIYTPFN
jgi:hypothetical protein